MTKTTRARYTLEFKQEAVRLVESGRSIAAAARTLGLVEQTLLNWVKAQRQGKLTGADSRPVSAQQMEISRLPCRAGAREDGARHPGKSDGILREAAAVKYAFVQRHRHVWPISVQCRVLRISLTGYHEHFVRKAGLNHGEGRRRHLSDDALLVHIKAIHAQTRCSYGWPRIWKELLARGLRVGKERVRGLMQNHGSRAKGKRKFVVTTDSTHRLPVALDLVQRRFTPAAPNVLCSGDITYI